VSWTEPARELMDRLGAGMDELWALLFAAQSGALQLALVVALDDDRSVTEAAVDLGQALEGLEWVRPQLPSGGPAVDLGPARFEDVPACRAGIAGLLTAAVEVVVSMLREHTEELDTPELLAVARAVTLVGSASCTSPAACRDGTDPERRPAPRRQPPPAARHGRPGPGPVRRRGCRACRGRGILGPAARSWPTRPAAVRRRPARARVAHVRRAGPPPGGERAAGRRARRGRSFPKLGGRGAAGRVGAAWGAAATAVRAAGDLLATHRDAAGGWGNQHAALLDDPRVRAIALAEVAALVVPLVETTEQLGLRSGQAGVPWSQVQQLLPPTGVRIRLAAQVRAAAGAPTDQAMAQIEVARPALRVGEPLVELDDRLGRLHRVAWQLTREPHVGAATLTDFAAAAVLVHEAAARTLRRLTRSAPDQALVPRLRNNVETVNRSGAAWQRVHLTLRSLRTATPGLAAVRGDMMAVRRLLREVTRAEGGIQATRALPVLLGGVGSYVDVASWNAQALDRVAGTGQAYLQGRTLVAGLAVPGDEPPRPMRVPAAPLR
jgi:hypothetical protein